MKVAKINFIILFLTFFRPHSLMAAGTYAPDVSSRGLGLVSAMAAFADDASAIFYNPAGIAMNDRSEFQLNMGLISPKIKVTNTNNKTSGKSDGKNLMGSFFTTYSFNKSEGFLKRLTLGLGFYAPHARSADYNGSQVGLAKGVASNVEHISKITKHDLSLAIGLDITSWLHLGVAPLMSFVRVEDNIAGLREKANGSEVGLISGLILSPWENLRIGVNYIFTQEVKIEGEGTLSNELGSGSGDYEQRARFPAILNVGVSYAFFNQSFRVALQYDREWTESLQEAKRNYTNIKDAGGLAPLSDPQISLIKAGNTYSLRLGMELSFNKNKIRSGLAYSERATPPEYTLPSKPDFDAKVAAIGYSKTFDKLEIHTGVNYTWTDRYDSDNLTFPAKYKASFYQFLAGVSYLY